MALVRREMWRSVMAHPLTRPLMNLHSAIPVLTVMNFHHVLLRPGTRTRGNAGTGVQRDGCSRIFPERYYPVKLIDMEACGASPFLGRALREQGHEVRLMPAGAVCQAVRRDEQERLH